MAAGAGPRLRHIAFSLTVINFRKAIIEPLLKLLVSSTLKGPHGRGARPSRPWEASTWSFGRPAALQAVGVPSEGPKRVLPSASSAGQYQPPCVSVATVSLFSTLFEPPTRATEPGTDALRERAKTSLS